MWILRSADATPAVTLVVPIKIATPITERQEHLCKILCKAIPILTSDTASTNNNDTHFYVNPHLKHPKHLGTMLMATDKQLARIEQAQAVMARYDVAGLPLDCFGRATAKRSEVAGKKSYWWFRHKQQTNGLAVPMSSTVRSKRVGFGVMLGQIVEGGVLCAVHFKSRRLWQQVEKENPKVFDGFPIVASHDGIRVLFMANQQINLIFKGGRITTSGIVAMPGSPHFNSKTTTAWVREPGERFGTKLLDAKLIGQLVEIARTNLPAGTDDENPYPRDNRQHQTKIYEVVGSGLEAVFEGQLYKSINNHVSIDCDLDLFARRVRMMFRDLSAKGRDWCARKWYYKAQPRGAVPAGMSILDVCAMFEHSWKHGKAFSLDFTEKAQRAGEQFDEMLPERLQGLDRRIVKLALGIMKLVGPTEDGLTAHMACSVVEVLLGCSASTANLHLRKLCKQGDLIVVKAGKRTSWDRYATVYTLSDELFAAVGGNLMVEKKQDTVESCENVEENANRIHRIPREEATGKKCCGVASANEIDTEFPPQPPNLAIPDNRGPPFFWNREDNPMF